MSGNVVARPSGSMALEKLTKMVCDLQIVQARRDDRGQLRDRSSPFDQRCMWCDVVGHVRRDSTNFPEALKNNVVYLWSGRVHACDMVRPLEVNIEEGSMKRIMEEATARNTEAIHYSVLVGIRVGGEKGTISGSNIRFWPLVLKGLSGGGYGRNRQTARRGGSKRAPDGTIR